MSILGSRSYYCRHIKGFANITSPLNGLLCGPDSSPNHSLADTWNPECTEAIDTIQSRLTTSLILGYPDFKLPFILETDATL